MAQPRLDDLDGLAVADQERRVEVPQIMEPQTGQADAFNGPAPDLAEAVAAERSSLGVREDKSVSAGGPALEVGSERRRDDVGQRDGSHRGFASSAGRTAAGPL